MSFREISIDSWIRKSQYHFFKDYDNPYFNITSNVDVTALKLFCDSNNLSFFIASIYCSLKACNDTEPFKTRFKEDKISIYDIVNPASTVLLDNKTFIYCFMAFNNDFNVFYENALISIESAKKEASFKSVDRPDVIYHSIIPWISFTSFSNARKKGQGDDIPRIVFGKYFNSEQKLMLPVSVEVHHALMDGFHVGQYFNSLQKAMNSLPNEKE